MARRFFLPLGRLACKARLSRTSARLGSSSFAVAIQEMYASHMALHKRPSTPRQRRRSLKHQLCLKVALRAK